MLHEEKGIISITQPSFPLEADLFETLPHLMFPPSPECLRSGLSDALGKCLTCAIE